MAEPETAGIEALSKKMDVLLNILLHFALKDTKFNNGKHNAADLAVWLHREGLGNAEIATIVGSTAESIRVSLHNRRKATKKKAKKGR